MGDEDCKLHCIAAEYLPSLTIRAIYLDCDSIGLDGAVEGWIVSAAGLRC